MTDRIPSALVTGASRGIGHGVALALARSGYGLTITSRSLNDLDDVARQVHEVGAPPPVCVAAELASEDDLRSVVAAHAERFVTMDALVLIAGVGTAGLVADFSLARLDKTIRVNFTAGFILIQQSMPLLRAAAATNGGRGAKIVAMSSITGVHPEPGLAAYGASKAALQSLVETVNAEEQGNGVTACSIAPGYVATDMSAWTTDAIPPHTMITVDDVVQVVGMALQLSRNAVAPLIVLSRTSGDLRRA